MRANLATAIIWAALCGAAGIDAAPGAAGAPDAAAAAGVPAAGGLTALPGEATEPVTLVNPGFEEQWAGWKPPQGEAFSIVAEPGAARSGRACLGFDGDRQTPYTPSVRQPLPEAGRARAAGGKWYLFAYLPSEKFVSDPASATPVEVRFTLADGRTVTRTFRPDFADWFSVPAGRP